MNWTTEMKTATHGNTAWCLIDVARTHSIPEFTALADGRIQLAFDIDNPEFADPGVAAAWERGEITQEELIEDEAVELLLGSCVRAIFDGAAELDSRDRICWKSLEESSHGSLQGNYNLSGLFRSMVSETAVEQQHIDALPRRLKHLSERDHVAFVTFWIRRAKDAFKQD